MSYAQEEREKLKKQFDKKTTARHCLMCGHNVFLVSEKIRINTDPTVGITYEAVAFVCAKCGHYNLHHLNILEAETP